MLIKNALAADCAGAFEGGLRIENGLITEIGDGLAPREGEEVLDARGMVLLPAFTDLHAHFRDPGYTHKETLESGSRAAAKGGYTFVNLMANTNPVCSTARQAAEVQRRMAGIGLCGANQVISVTRDFSGTDISHLDELPDGIRILCEDGKGVQSADVMARVMQKAAARGWIIQSHAEDMQVSPYDYRLAENLETARNIKLAEYYGAWLHLTHVSTKESMADIIDAKLRGAMVTCDVTPHHIWFSEQDYRVNPPIREAEDVQFLLQAIAGGYVDCIATDHAPHTPADKKSGAPGMVGLETAFSVCYTRLVQEGGLPLEALSRLLSFGPASILGLRKGRLLPGWDGDIVLADLRKTYRIDSEEFESMGRNTPFAGMTLCGKIMATVKGGKLTYRDKEFLQ
ncbi:MAG: dihydroorotase [Oscillospiraceae bacterium]|nr:dihydroorotase [Oscillospiraceae bacterium]